MNSKIDTTDFLFYLENIIIERKNNKKDSYTSQLFQSGTDRILQKIGEEATEFIIDAKNKNRKRIIEEAADLTFHLMVALVDLDASIKDVICELEERHQKKS